MAKQQQNRIIKDINMLVDTTYDTPDQKAERRHLLFLGVAIGVGQQNLPPFWLMCILSGTSDRIQLDKPTNE